MQVLGNRDLKEVASQWLYRQGSSLSDSDGNGTSPDS
jgi:hypothetical protein